MAELPTSMRLHLYVPGHESWARTAEYRANIQWQLVRVGPKFCTGNPAPMYDRTLDGPAKPHDQVQHSKSSAAFLYLIMTDQAAPAATALLRANSRSLAAPRTALARILAIWVL